MIGTKLKVLAAAALVAVALLGLGLGRTDADQPPNPPGEPSAPTALSQARGGNDAAANETRDAARIVRDYFRLIPSDEEPAKALDLFLNPDVAVTGVSGGAGRDLIWTKPAREVVERARRQAPCPHVVDAITTTYLGNSLAVVLADVHTRYVRLRAAFTLTREGGEWRITGLTTETRHLVPE